ncbi:MAG: T9SS type A sorting domain-containing protein [Bacteroidetes bacterium]|nr:T9SS type A sorting domain-containing protein [Bacteroidota bacterium]
MKRALPILSFILLIAICTKAQSRTLPPDGTERMIKFYPNPATSVITFEFQKAYDKGYTIEVYSFLGRKVSEIQNAQQRTTINLNDYNRGVYIYQLKDRNGMTLESGKFQVSK